MGGYVMESRKGRRSFFALVAALVAATVGFYLMTLSTEAKPAQAATPACKAGAYAPRILSSSGNTFMQGRVEMVCSTRQPSIFQSLQIQRQNANGGYSVVWGDDEYVFNVSSRLFPSGFRCTAPYIRATYRTVSVRPSADYTYSSVYSRNVSLVC